MKEREIKFRALVKWKGLDPDWIYYSTLVIPYAFNPDEGKEPEKIIVKDLQYTGLKDKHGKEIYEGDIVKYTHYMDGKDIPLIGIIAWDEYNACFNIVGWFDNLGNRGIRRLKNFEVIGNIYENPELCKSNQDSGESK